MIDLILMWFFRIRIFGSIYNARYWYSFFRGSEKQQAVILKIWEGISKKEIEEAKTVSDASIAYHYAPPANEIIALISWTKIFLCEMDRVTTFEEAVELHDFVPPKHKELDHRMRSVMVVKLKEKINGLTDIKEVHAVLKIADALGLGSLALAKWLEISKRESSEAAKAISLYSRARSYTDPKRKRLAREKYSNYIWKICRRDG